MLNGVEWDVMTTQEVADYLRLSVMTVYKLAQEGKIPAMRLGRKWRFKKELIDEWFRTNVRHLLGES